MAIRDSKSIKRLKSLYEKSENVPYIEKKSVIQTVSTEATDSMDTQRYVFKDLTKTIMFFIFAILVIFMASVFITDYSYAKDLRTRYNITKIAF